MGAAVARNFVSEASVEVAAVMLLTGGGRQ